MTQNQTSTANKINSYLMFIVLIVLGLSVVALFSAVYAYTIQNEVAAGFLVIIGVFALALSAAVLYQTKRRTTTLKNEAPKVMTTIECKKCGFKSTRDFQRGDYVFKELDACPKCADQKQMITGVYKEIKEKEKTYAV
jgi:predicted Zn-ribbon and HTH transcriptional regulator